MNETSQRPSLYRAFLLARRERDAFLYIDVLAASTGVLAPLIFGLIYPNANFLDEASKLLQSGGVYIFSIAVLAASSSFVYLEKRNKFKNEVRDDYDRTPGIKAAVLIATGMFLSGLQFASTSLPTVPRVEGSKAVSAAIEHSTKLTSNTDSSIQGSAVEKGKGSSLSIVWQFAYLLISLWLSLRLFCLRNIDAIPGESERIEKRRREEAKELLALAQKDQEFFDNGENK